MKNLFKNTLMCCLAAVAFFSCTETHELFDLQESRLSFDYPKNQYGKADSIVRFTFAYHKSDILQDTVWVKMNTMGFLGKQDRAFTLEQVEATLQDTYEGLEKDEELHDAEPGKHYIAFDDPEMKKHLLVKAGENYAKFPVIVKRDASLLNGKYYLKFQLKPNENFVGYLGADRYFVIELTEKFVKPVEWDFALEYYFGGTYGPVKLRFMVDSATWTVNDKWFTKNFADAMSIDMGYTGYLSSYFTDKLIAVNKERKAKGLDVLTEPDGTIVQFCNFGQPTPYI